MNTLLVTLILSACPVQTPPGPPLEEKLVATIPEDPPLDRWNFSFSPTGSNVAYWTTKGDNIVRVGDRRSGPWVDISKLIWSQDGKTFAFVGNKGGKLDQFGVAQGGQFCVVVGNTPQEYFDEIIHLTVAPDGRVAYVAANAGTKRFQVVDGKKQDPYYNVWEAAFSDDGKRLAYVVQPTKDEAYVICDGQQGPKFKHIRPPIFSRDGRVLAYAAMRGTKFTMVVDGKSGEEFDDVSYQPAMSADGKVVAYSATLNKKEFLVVGDRKGKEYEKVESPVVSADGKNVACKVNIGTKWSVLIGDQQGPEFDNVAPFNKLIFSPDGTRLAYSAKRGRKWVVFDGEKFSEEFDFASFWVVFSPTGKLVAHAAKIEGKSCVVVGTKKSPFFESVSTPQFSADGRKIAFGIRKGRELWWKVMDVE
jgi:Tol biopolymer transport system component